MGAGGRVRIMDRDGGQGGAIARVVDGRLLVTTEGGGGGPAANVTIIAPIPLPVSDNGGSLTIDDGGGSITVDGFPASQTVDDGGGSLTVDGAVSILNFPASQTVDDGGLSLTIDGTVAVSNFPASQTVDDGGGTISIDDGGGSITIDGTVTSASLSVVDANNSTVVPLAGGGNFTGAGTDLLNYRAITITLATDKDSPADGMKFEFSTDNVNWDDTYSFTMTGNDTRRFQFPVTSRYFRVNYTTNAGPPGAQTFFRVQTLLHPSNVLTSIHRLQDNTSKDRSAQIMKSAIIAQVNGTGDFVNIQASGGGILKVDPDNIQVLGSDVDFSNPLPVAIVENKLPLTASTNGRPIAIAAVGTPGTNIHTSIADYRDLVTLWATNRTGTDVRLTVEVGGVAAGDQTRHFIPSFETVPIVVDQPIQQGLTIAAFHNGGGADINISGYYKRELI